MRLASSRGVARALRNGARETTTVEVFDAPTKKFLAPMQLGVARNGCSVARLADGTILVAGGFTGGQKHVLGIDGQAVANAELESNP